jgi:hypothetical protein
MPPQTNVASFVLRFMQDGTDTDAPPASWRGVVKHVQTNEEKHFTSFADAIEFIAGYVNLKEYEKHETRKAQKEERP